MQIIGYVANKNRLVMTMLQFVHRYILLENCLLGLFKCDM